MTQENKNSESNATNDMNAQPESPQSILERRLAEINARRQQQNPQDSNGSPQAAAPTPAPESGAAPQQPQQPDAHAQPEQQPKQENRPEEAPEIKPELSSAEETKTAAEATEAIAEAQAAATETSETEPAPTAITESTATAAPVATAPDTANTPAPVAPELKPELKTEQEEKETAALTETFVSAQAEAETASAPAEEPAAKPAESVTASTTTNTPEAASTEASSQTPASAATSEQNGEEEEEDQETQADYGSMSTEELRSQLHTMLREPKRNSRNINEAHRQYELKMQEERAEALKQFVAGGGEADDFEFRPGKEHQDLEQAYQQYREGRMRDQRQEEENKQKNLQRKRELLDRMRTLVEAAETKSSVDQLKEIQAEWKAIGPVPQGESQELWNSYHALLDIFYNNRSIFFELKELDRKRNLDAKIQLCERAEALLNEPSINKSIAELRHLHEEWKSIGPVPNEQRDSIWDRFIQASEKVHQRRRDYLANRKAQEQENLTKKQAILAQVEPFANFNSDRINDWRDKTDEIQKIKEQWDAAGLVPKENADEINKRFWGSYKTFFQHKNQFFKSLDEQKMANLRIKTQLCEEAEALKDSEDWDSTKERLIQLQKQWKTIGRVPDKYSDKIWQRFRAACNEFFDRRQAEGKRKEEELDKQAAEKIEFSDKLAERLVVPCTDCGTMEEYEQLLKQWHELGAGSRRTNARVEEKFYALMEKYLDTVPGLSNEQKNELTFKLQVERLKSSPDAGKSIGQKEHNLRREITQLENDIRTLKTNIEFFGRSKNADKLREEYEGRIEDARQRIETLQKQLDMLHR